MDILTYQGYMDIVDGLEILLTIEAKAKLWKKKDWAALSIIWLRVADKMIVHIASATTSGCLGYNSTDARTAGCFEHCPSAQKIISGSVRLQLANQC